MTTSRTTFARIAFALAALIAGCAARAADFSVTPIRLDMAPDARSGLVSVTNEDTRPLRMQLRLFEWSQDASGADVYRESGDLIYFPRVMSLAPKEKRLVRVGLRRPLGDVEHTYRLFIDDLPDAPGPAQGSGVTFSLRFALPIFVPPAKPQPRAAIELLELANGRLRIGVSNPGNQQFRIESITARGSAFQREQSGWYLLAGSRREHIIEVPAESCRALRRIEVSVKTDKLAIERDLNVDPRMCSR